MRRVDDDHLDSGVIAVWNKKTISRLVNLGEGPAQSQPILVSHDARTTPPACNCVITADEICKTTASRCVGSVRHAALTYR